MAWPFAARPDGCALSIRTCSGKEPACWPISGISAAKHRKGSRRPSTLTHAWRKVLNRPLAGIKNVRTLPNKLSTLQPPADPRLASAPSHNTASNGVSYRRLKTRGACCQGSLCNPGAILPPVEASKKTDAAMRHGFVTHGGRAHILNHEATRFTPPPPGAPSSLRPGPVVFVVQAWFPKRRLSSKSFRCHKHYV